jgi:serine protease Do
LVELEIIYLDGEYKMKQCNTTSQTSALTTCMALLSCVFTFAAVSLPTPAIASLPLAVENKPLPSLAPMLQKTIPAVVNVAIRGRYNSAADPFIEPDSKGRGNRRNGKEFHTDGSGVIVDAKDGYILTNAHVTNQADTITVTLNDGRRFQAKLVGQDTASDIAVLKINTTNLTAIPLATASKAQVGDFVVAIGSPFGLKQSVTSGIVSAVQRNDLGIEGYEDFIRTDASINPGNSGGALVNLKGQLVGINTAILAPNGGNVGIGFAIPADMAKNIIDQIIKYGSVSRGVAGIMMQTVTPELAHAFKEPEAKGALVTQVVATAPAAKAGLKVGDIIEAINGEAVNNSGQVRNAIGLVRAGSTIDLQILRNNKKQTIKLVTTEPQEYEKASRESNPFLFGMVMRNFDAQMPNFGHVQGIQILSLKDNCPAWQAGLRPGDLIISANNQPAPDLNKLNKIATQDNEQLLINVFRGNSSAFFVISKG